MVKTESTMLPLGYEAPGFSLPNVDGQLVSRDDLSIPRRWSSCLSAIIVPT